MKIIKLSLRIFLFVFFVSKDLYSLDINKIADASKRINIKKAGDAETKQEGPVIAMLPFDYTYDVGKRKAESAFNETAISLISTGKFQVYSAKRWFDESFLKSSGEKKQAVTMNIDEIAEKAKNDFLPMDYLCKGFVFKSGLSFGIKIILYSVKDKKINYYYRTTDAFNNFDKITDQIAFEIAERSEKFDNVLIDRTIFVDDFKIIMKNYKKDKKGVLQEVNVPGIIIDRVNYKEEDDFFSDLLLYNLYITGIFNVKKLNIKNKNGNAAKKNGNAAGSLKNDYLLEGTVDLSNKKNILYIKVINSANNQICYEKSSILKSLSISSIYQTMRSNSKNIILSLLSSDERNRVGEVHIDAFYNNNDMFCNNYFLGRGMQKDLILPVRVNEAEIQFYKKWIKKAQIDIFPYNKNKLNRSKIKYLIGLCYTSRIMLHPLFNNNTEIPFSESLNYTSEELFNNKKSELNNKFHVSSLNGMGINFSITSKYFELSTLASFIFGEVFRNFSVNNHRNIEINGEKVENLTCSYFIDKYSLIFDLNIMPSVIFPPASSSFRFYAGSGLFASLSYNNFNERIKGRAVINSIKYNFTLNYYNNDSMYLSLGVSPEFGFTYNFYKFILKAGFSYNFDLYKYLIFSDIKNSGFNTFSTSNFCIKIGVNYYLN